MRTSLQQTKTISASETRSRRARRQSLTTVLDIVIGLVVFVAAWQVIFWLRFWPPYLMPSPSSTWGEFLLLAKIGTLQVGITDTLERIVVDFGVTLLLGLGVGVLMVYFKRFGRMMNSFSLGLQSFPSLAWVPFAIIIIGLDNEAILFVVVLSSVFSIMMSTYAGLRNVPSIYIRAAKNMGTGNLALFGSVMMPAALPSLIAGVRQAWSFAWHALIGAEMLMGAIGLGGILYDGSQFLKMNEVIASMIVIFAIGLAADRLLFYRLEESVRNKWGLNRPSG
jgi:NitT/TauT family transport system permease protein